MNIMVTLEYGICYSDSPKDMAALDFLREKGFKSTHEGRHPKITHTFNPCEKEFNFTEREILDFLCDCPVEAQLIHKDNNFTIEVTV